MHSATILVVDDEQLIRWSLNDRLSQAGYRIVEADTARSAIERHAEGVDPCRRCGRAPTTSRRWFTFSSMASTRSFERRSAV